MVRITNMEKTLLEMLTTAKPEVVAINMGIEMGNLNARLTGLRRKEKIFQRNLNYLKKYRSVLHPKKTYKGISEG